MHQPAIPENSCLDILHCFKELQPQTEEHFYSSPSDLKSGSQQHENHWLTTAWNQSISTAKGEGWVKGRLTRCCSSAHSWESFSSPSSSNSSSNTSWRFIASHKSCLPTESKIDKHSQIQTSDLQQPGFNLRRLLQKASTWFCFKQQPAMRKPLYWYLYATASVAEVKKEPQKWKASMQISTQVQFRPWAALNQKKHAKHVARNIPVSYLDQPPQVHHSFRYQGCLRTTEAATGFDTWNWKQDCAPLTSFG